MINAIQDFVEYLYSVKKVSLNTEISYEHDLKKMEAWMRTQGIFSVQQATADVMGAYLQYLEREKLAAATISRNIAAVRAFFQYQVNEKGLSEDPTTGLKAPKVEKKAPELLSVEAIDRILSQPDLTSAKGIRDKAMLELMYATGIRVSELIHLKAEDADLKNCVLTVRDYEKVRLVPFGTKAREAVEQYLKESREILQRGNEESFLFLNCSGKSLSRQGFWKVLKGYVKQAGITADITPHTLRHSFSAHLLENGADVKSVQEMLGYVDASGSQEPVQISRLKDVYDRTHPRSGKTAEK